MKNPFLHVGRYWYVRRENTIMMVGLVRIGNVGAQKTDFFVPTGGLRKLAGSVRIGSVGGSDDGCKKMCASGS